MAEEEFENNPDVSRSLDFFKQYIKYAREKYQEFKDYLLPK